MVARSSTRPSLTKSSGSCPLRPSSGSTCFFVMVEYQSGLEIRLWTMRETLNLQPKNRLSLDVPKEGLDMALTWSDPQQQLGSDTSERGKGASTSGRDITKQFLETNELTWVNRSHEVRSGGISLDHDLSHDRGSVGRRLLGLMTVFSAANYADKGSNRGGIIKVTVDEGNVTVENMTFVAGARPRGYIKAKCYLMGGRN